jgi:hypothetical protein
MKGETIDAGAVGAAIGLLANRGTMPRSGRASAHPRFAASSIYSFFYFFFYSYRGSFAVRPGEESA